MEKINPYTMLQKLSKCEVKTLLKFDHFTATQILCEIKFWQIQTVQKCHFWPFLETLNFEFLANLALESCSNLLKSKFTTSKIVKINNFGLCEFTTILFHVQ